MSKWDQIRFIPHRIAIRGHEFTLYWELALPGSNPGHVARMEAVDGITEAVARTAGQSISERSSGG